MEHRKPSASVIAAVMLAGLVGGCDTTPETQPMDEPLNQESAMEVDERMSRSTGTLLEEEEGRLQED